MFVIVISGKRKKVQNADDLRKKEKLDNLHPDQIKMIARAERTGDTLYAKYDPYAAEITGKSELIMAWDQAEVDELFYRLREEI